METSKTSTGEQWNDLTLFAVDTPVSPSPQQAKEKEQTTHDTSGPGLGKPLASYDPITQSWKMFGDISLWGEFKLLENLPPSGMTQSGVLFLQPLWVRLTGETELSSWPTPTAMDYLPARSQEALERQQNNNRPGRTTPPTLKDAVAYPRNWPTPTARDWKGAAGFKKESRNLADLTYLAQIRSGTRDGRVGNGGSLNPTWVEWLMGFPPGWTDLED